MTEARSLAVGGDNEEMNGVDEEGNLIQEEELGGEEDDWQENEDGKKKEPEENHVSGMRFWLHGDKLH